MKLKALISFLAIVFLSAFFYVFKLKKEGNQLSETVNSEINTVSSDAHNPHVTKKMYGDINPELDSSDSKKINKKQTGHMLLTLFTEKQIKEIDSLIEKGKKNEATIKMMNIAKQIYNPFIPDGNDNEEYQKLLTEAGTKYQKGEYSEAMNIWREIIEYEPDHVAANNYLAQALLAIDEVDEARVVLESAIQLSPQIEEFAFMLRYIYRVSSIEDEGYEFLRNLQTEDGKRPYESIKISKRNEAHKNGRFH